MVSSEILPIIIIFGVLYVVVAVLAYVGIRHVRRSSEAKEREAKRRLYELAILKEISDRTGYSLNMQKILDVIAGSLNQFLEYSAVSYMLLEPSRVVFKSDLERSVSPRFIQDIRGRMFSALSALLGRDLSEMEIEETITGALMLDVIDEPVRSYFNIPLVIGERLVGILTVSHTKAGLYQEQEMAILYKIINQASRAATQLEDVIKTEQGKVIAMIESMIEGVVMTDTDYRLIASNPSATKIINHEGAPTIFDFIDAFKGVLDIREKLEEAIKLDKVITIDEMMFRDKYYQVVFSPVRASKERAGGAILGGVVIFHDVTHEKEAEKMRSDFTSMMVHELRSPLGNIKKIGEVMKSSKVLEDKQTSGEYVSMLYESSSIMLDLVNDLLDVAKLEAGKFDVDKQSANIKNILLERIKFFEATARDASLSLKLIVAENVPSTISLDAKRITQVMNNLLSNALKYTFRGGVITTFCFVHRKGRSVNEEARLLSIPFVVYHMPENTADMDDCVVVGVTDTGEGIAQDQFTKLFNKFTQFTSSVRKGADHKGTGLGLVIAKGIIEAHGGVMGVGSKEGAGSTFYFTIP